MPFRRSQSPIRVTLSASHYPRHPIRVTPIRVTLSASPYPRHPYPRHPIRVTPIRVTLSASPYPRHPYPRHPYPRHTIRVTLSASPYSSHPIRVTPIRVTLSESPYPRHPIRVTLSESRYPSHPIRVAATGNFSLALFSMFQVPDPSHPLRLIRVIHPLDPSPSRLIRVKIRVIHPCSVRCWCRLPNSIFRGRLKPSVDCLKHPVPPPETEGRRLPGPTRLPFPAPRNSPAARRCAPPQIASVH